MHVVYLSLEKPTLNRAPALQSLHTLRGLVEAGAEVTYVTPWPVRRILATSLAMTGRPFPPEVRVVSVGPGPDLPVLVHLWPSQVWKGIQTRLNRIARSLQEDPRETVVYTRFRRIAASFPRAHAPPLLFEYHEPQSLTQATLDEAAAGWRVPALEAEERRAVHNAAGLVTVSRAHHDEAPGLYGFDGPRWLIPNAVDLETFAVPAEQRRPSPGRLLYVGALDRWKGLEIALAALVRVPAASLSIVGGVVGSEPWNQLTQLVERLNLNGRVQFLGLVPQQGLRPLLATAVAGLLPLDGAYSLASRYTCPLKMLEYMAAGLPVIASDLPSVREFTRDGQEALLTPPGDVTALAGAMQRLCSEPALVELLGAAGRQAALAHTWLARGQRILTACGEILQRRRRRAATLPFSVSNVADAARRQAA
jgi:glycosyltransferase involved in cell wall biosynthesis